MVHLCGPLPFPHPVMAKSHMLVCKKSGPITYFLKNRSNKHKALLSALKIANDYVVSLAGSVPSSSQLAC